jgi:uncharacterized Zn finger protein
MKRATKAEVAARVEEVLHARLNGAEFHDLQALAVEKEWQVSDSQLWRYVQAADQRIEKTFEPDRQKIFRRHVLQRRALYARALQDGDYRTALAVLRDEAELHGLYTRKVELSGAGGGPIKVEAMTDEERRAAIANILARYGSDGDPAHRQRARDAG